MQKKVKSIDEIEKEIFKKLAGIEGQPTIISIDGKDGSGKSYLALCLCCRNENFIYFDLDTHYWSSKKLPYVKNIDYEMLQNNIRNTLSDKEIVVIDSVCTLSILEKLSLNPKIAIYIKKLDDSSRWISGKNFDYNCDLESLIEERKRVSQIPLELGEPESITTYIETLSDEVIRYHHRYKPDENADIIYERYQ